MVQGRRGDSSPYADFGETGSLRWRPFRFWSIAIDNRRIFYYHLARLRKTIYRPAEGVCVSRAPSICNAFRPAPPPASNCVRAPSDILKLPDPAIYDQTLEIAQGRAPTWDSPDIFTHDVDPLRPLDQIRVILRNNSPDASAFNTQVQVAWSEFGIGMPRVPIGAVRVDLARAGFPGSTKDAFIPPPPAARAQVKFGVFVSIDHPYDRDRTNNKGEQALDVKHTRDVGPNPTFEFPLRNSFADPIEITLLVNNPQNWFFTALVATVAPLSPFFLNPGETRSVSVNIAVPTGTPPGTLGTFSVYATTPLGLLGGVALVVIVD